MLNKNHYYWLYVHLIIEYQNMTQINIFVSFRYFLAVPPKSFPREELSLCVPTLFACVEDRAAEVRKAAADCVFPFMLHLGYDAMFKQLDKLKVKRIVNVHFLCLHLFNIFVWNGRKVIYIVNKISRIQCIGNIVSFRYQISCDRKPVFQTWRLRSISRLFHGRPSRNQRDIVKRSISCINSINNKWNPIFHF